MLNDPSLPFVSGVHGSLKRLDKDVSHQNVSTDFTTDKLSYLHQAQRRSVKYVDIFIHDFTKRVPNNTHIIVTSDHGELFGEDGFFGHGPICHPAVNKVPFLEFHKNTITI